MIRLGKTKEIFFKSPMIFLSSISCGWLLIRITIYLLKVGPTEPSPFDFPFFRLSPVATEYNMTFTLTWVTLVGIVTALIGLLRKKEKWRLLGIVTLLLNIVLWYWASSLTLWALAPPPGVDY